MSLKKKIISFLTTAACAVSCMFTAGMLSKDQPTVTAAGVTGKDAAGITSQMKIGWNLGNSLDSTNDNLGISSSPKKFATSWGNPEPTTELIDTVKKGGFNTLRLPTTWYGHIYEENGEYKVDDTWVEYVKKFVDYAYNQDMFVILNIHHENFINVPMFTDDTLKDATAKMTGIWKRLAEEFKDYDQKLIFEGMNEPREMSNPSNSEWGDGDENSWGYINKLNKVFVETVRGQGSSANKERLLMLPGYHAGNSVSTVKAIEVKPEYGNVALSVHAYNPYFFCMATDEYANHEYPGKSGYGEDYATSLQNMFAEYKEIIKEKGCPIVMGEFGASDFDNTQSRINWAKDYLTFAKDAGIPCVLWDNNVVAETVTNPESAGEAHGYIYRMTNTWYKNSKPVIEAMMETVGINNYELPDYVAYEKPSFSWNDIEIGDNWIEIYKSEKGDPLKTWEPLVVSGYKQYLNENYDLVMIMDAEQEPALVAQTSTVVGTDENGDPATGWYYVSSDNANNTDFVYYYTYQDVVSAVTATGKDSIEKVNNIYVSARMSAATAYGLYAIPKGDVPPPTGPAIEKPDVQVGADWKVIYENPKEDALKAWDPEKVENGKSYVNEDTTLVMVYNKGINPALVVQTSTVIGEDKDGKPETGWYYIESSNEKNKDGVVYYTYDDIVKALEAKKDSVDKITDIYVSARAEDAVIYNLYAVPANGSSNTDIKGDVNGDGAVDVFDSVSMKRYILEITSNINLKTADLDGNGRVNITDLVYLNMFLINSDQYPL